jgi:hypothetical protein
MSTKSALYRRAKLSEEVLGNVKAYMIKLRMSYDNFIATNQNNDRFTMAENGSETLLPTTPWNIVLDDGVAWVSDGT